MKTNIFLGFLNVTILLFCFFRFGLPFVDYTQNVLDHTESIGVFLASQANQFALLQVGLAALGILIAIIALWGYSQISVSAQQSAQKKVDEVVPKLVMKTLEELGPEKLGEMLMEVHNKHVLKNNSKEVYESSVQSMFKDPVDFNHNLTQ